MSEKIKILTETLFNVLASNAHNTNAHCYKFIRNAISDGIYKFSERHLYSGKISYKAQIALNNNELTRKQLCKEHFIPRTKTALDIISVFDYKITNNQITNTEIKFEISNLLERGSYVNLVLSSENQELAKYQKNHELTPEECYELAGVDLVDDEPRVIYHYEYEGKLYPSLVEISRELNITKYRVSKLHKNGLIRKTV